MSMVHRLLEQLRQRGLHIEFGNKDNVLLLCGPAAEKTPEVIDAVKKFKPELLKLYAPPPGEPKQAVGEESPAAEGESSGESSDPEGESCQGCGRVTGAEDRAVLATNHYLCDRWECPHKAAARRQERWAA